MIITWSAAEQGQLLVSRLEELLLPNDEESAIFFWQLLISNNFYNTNFGIPILKFYIAV